MKYCIKFFLSYSLLLVLSTALAQDGIQVPQSVVNSKSKSAFPYHSMDTGNLKPLKLGEKVPDIIFTQMVNYPMSNAKLSDFAGKLVILDFWSTSCGICISEFPKMHNLQKKFADSLMIITVGFDGNKIGSINKFIQNNKDKKYHLTLPTAVQTKDDKTIEKLFPFVGLPHEVWIGPDRTLLGITSHLAVNEVNISNALEGKSLSTISKIKVKNLTKDDAFLIAPNIEAGTYTSWGSLFSGYRAGYMCGWPFGEQYDSNFVRFFDINRTFYDYFVLAYKLDMPWISKKRIMVVPNDENFLKDWVKMEDDKMFSDFRAKNLFCYELILPKSKFSLTDAYSHMKKDLDYFFNVESKIGKREIKYLALIRSSKIDKLASKKQEVTSVKKLGTMEYELNIRSDSINTLITELESVLSTPYLIFDETGYTGLVDIDIPHKKLTIDYAKRVLNKYDLDLVVKRKVENMLIIKRKF